MSPWIVGFCVFFGYPLVYSAYLSFTHYDLLSSPRWIGTANYDFMLHGDPNVGRQCATPCG
jgi:multiple sugar transport system permease protein